MKKETAIHNLEFSAVLVTKAKKALIVISKEENLQIYVQ